MKKLHVLPLAFLIFLSSSLFAQGTMEIQKTKTKSNQSNDRGISQNDESLTVKIRNTGTGVEVFFNQAIVSPRDAASGLPTGKRQHKPFVFTKEYDKSSPLFAKSGGTGKVSVQDISVTFTSKGRTQKLNVTNGEFVLPADGQDDDCNLAVSWSWGQTQGGQSSPKGNANFKLAIQDGACVSVKEVGGMN